MRPPVSLIYLTHRIGSKKCFHRSWILVSNWLGRCELFTAKGTSVAFGLVKDIGIVADDDHSIATVDQLRLNSPVQVGLGRFIVDRALAKDTNVWFVIEIDHAIDIRNSSLCVVGQAITVIVKYLEKGLFEFLAGIGQTQEPAILVITEAYGLSNSHRKWRQLLQEIAHPMPV